MRISSSDIQMESARNSSLVQEVRTSTMTMIGTAGLLIEPEPQMEEGTILVGEEAREAYDGEQSFEEKKQALQKKLREMSSYSPLQELEHLRKERDALSTVRSQCMQYLVSLFFGEVEGPDFKELLREARSNDHGVYTKVTESVYHQHQIYLEEQEETKFSAEGVVRTADGREIPVNLSVGMSRSFSAYYESQQMQIQTRMCDPLVINLDGNVAEMRDQTFYFDIDGDGALDRIAELGSGSGYLAADWDGSGSIQDGSELFGPASGDGFRDLAAYDSDGNGWIDENDAVWKYLRIWTRDEEGRDLCYSLEEKGVGAISLEVQDTEFSLNTASNEVNGRIRRTGIFLYENGMAGTIQHVDAAKKEEGFDSRG